MEVGMTNDKLGLYLSVLLDNLAMDPNYRLDDEDRNLLENIIDRTKFATIPLELIRKHSSLNIDKGNDYSTITLTFKVEAKSTYVEESKEFKKSLKEHLINLLVDSISVL